MDAWGETMAQPASALPPANAMRSGGCMPVTTLSQLMTVLRRKD